MQQLGLTLTKSYRLHLRKTTRHMGIKPLKNTIAVTAPPGFESINATDINDAGDIQRVALV